MSDEAKNKILEYSTKRFLLEGFHKITMDEIANELLISKKTIYKYFPSKKELVLNVSEQLINQVESEKGNILNYDGTIIEKLFLLTEMLAKIFFMINEKWFFDLQKIYPDIWEIIEKKRTEILTHFFDSIISEGKEEKSIVLKNNNLLRTFTISAIRGIINPEFLISNSLSIKDAIENVIELIFNAILTEKGKKEFLKIKKRKK